MTELGIRGYAARDLDGELRVFLDKPDRYAGQYFGNTLVRVFSEKLIPPLGYYDDPMECEVIIKFTPKTNDK